MSIVFHLSSRRDQKLLALHQRIWSSWMKLFLQTITLLSDLLRWSLCLRLWIDGRTHWGPHHLCDQICGNDLCVFISSVKTHLGPHQESHGRVLWWITCKADTWLYFFLKIYWESIFHKEHSIPTLPQRRRCRASRQTWRKSTTRPKTECATSLESLNNQPDDRKNWPFVSWWRIEQFIS